MHVITFKRTSKYSRYSLQLSDDDYYRNNSLGETQGRYVIASSKVWSLLGE